MILILIMIMFFFFFNGECFKEIWEVAYLGGGRGGSFLFFGIDDWTPIGIHVLEVGACLSRELECLQQICDSGVQLSISCLDVVDLGFSLGIDKLEQLSQIENVVHKRFLISLELVNAFLKGPKIKDSLVSKNFPHYSKFIGQSILTWVFRA
jgi:hypothetical protein